MEKIQLQNDTVESDKIIIESINNNDIKAFEHLFKTYHASLCSYCYNKVRDKDVAKEIVQDVFVNIFKNRKSWTPKNSIKAYLFKAIRNRLINYYKHPSRNKKSELSVEELESKEEMSPLEIFSKKEFREAYVKAVEKLPEKCREILILVKDNGFSYKEVSEIQSISVKTVESQMRLAFQKLRKNLGRFH
ncbi:MAG: RNA polymerase sigma-70 factor [Bacteroidetes bacterium]|nr:RNA polymerase sigma-70 factor [Bacteroidota bacterium]